jgi:hypothetical protein
MRHVKLTTSGWPWIAAGLAALALGLARPTAGPSRAPTDPWTGLVDAGNLAGTGVPAATLDGRPLTRRAAYLLAFHVAQDAGDPEHVLAVAARFEQVGDAELARHVRGAARHLLAELGGDGREPGAP